MNLTSGLGGLILAIIAFFVCLSVHEAAHAFVADKLGDPTSKILGRLSLNPLAHIDPFGTVLLPLFLLLVSGGQFAFGYAKPVMVDIRNFKDPVKDNLLTALAGPAANLTFAAILGVIISAIPSLGVLTILVQLNVILGVFNLIPIPPLDGSKIWAFFLSDEAYYTLERIGPFILIAFLLFMETASGAIFSLAQTISNALTHLF